MRVTNKMMTNNFLRDMNFNLGKMQRLQTQLTSGKEFKKPSDDPFKVARSMQLYSDINANKQYNENIEDTINWLDTTDTSVGQMNNVFQRVHELMISAGNGGYSSSERSAIKDEINERISEISQIMNTSFDGKFIFGGSRGTVKPLESTGGTVYKNAETIEITDLTKWQGKELKFNYENESGVNEEFTVTLPDKINSKEEIISEINKTIKRDGGDIELEARYNIVDGGVMFVSGETNKITLTDVSGDIDDIASGSLEINKTIIENNSNKQLKYFAEDGDFNDIDKAMIASKLYTEVSTGVTIGYNVAATDLIEFTDPSGKKIDMMQTLNSIVNHLDGKTSEGADADGEDAIKALLNDDLDSIKKILENVSRVRSKVGAMQNRMDSANKRNEEENFNMIEILSKTEDIDIAEKTMEYATMQTVYMASLQTSAKVIQPSLIDYLR